MTYPCSLCLRSFLAVFTGGDGKDRCRECRAAYKPAPTCVRKFTTRQSALARYREKREGKTLGGDSDQRRETSGNPTPLIPSEPASGAVRIRPHGREKYQPIRLKEAMGIVSPPVIDELFVERLMFLLVLEQRIWTLEVGECLEELAQQGRIIKLDSDLYKHNRVQFILSPA